MSGGACKEEECGAKVRAICDAWSKPVQRDLNNVRALTPRQLAILSEYNELADAFVAKATELHRVAFQVGGADEA